MYLVELLAQDIFIADGGVDDYEEMTDDDLAEIAANYLRQWADERSQLQGIVDAARKLGKELSS